MRWLLILVNGYACNFLTKIAQSLQFLMACTEFDAWEMCVRLKDNGLLAKPTHGDIIRLAPPLTINKTQMDEAIQILSGTMNSYVKK